MRNTARTWHFRCARNTLAIHPIRRVAQALRGWENRGKIGDRQEVAAYAREPKRPSRTALMRTRTAGNVPSVPDFFRRRHQSTLHWITVHVAKLLDVLAFTENIEIVIAALPEGAHRRVLPQCHLVRALAPPPASPGDALFQHLHGQGEGSDSRLSDQQVEVLGHNYKAPDDKIQFPSHIFQDLEKHIATAR